MDEAGRLAQVPESQDQIAVLIQQLEKNDWQSTVKRSDQSLSLPAALPDATGNPELPSVVIVDKGAHRTHVLQLQENGQIAEVLTVPNAVGKSSTPTPNRRWEVSDKRLDPIWYPPKSIGGDPVAPFKQNPRNPIGLAFIRLDGTNYGMHGTNRPDQIGKSVSHGCVRHNNADILKVYPLVNPGTVVYTVNKFEGTKISYEDFRKKQ